jgi:shikimate dehydrogenase
MKIESGITGKTKIIGIIGNPIKHSISPQLHNTISRQLGIDIVYVPFNVCEKDLEDAVKGLKSLNVLGFNVTIPHKESIIGCLDEISNEAKLMGSVNTVKNIEGKLYGYNTDARGFIKAFTHETKKSFKDKTVAIIGGGGTARALAVKVALEGVKKIYIINRTLSRAIDIADVVNSNIKNIAEVVRLNSDESTFALHRADIIVNTTPLGMYPYVDRTPLDNTFLFSKDQIVFDVIYNPPKTRFLSQAQKCGCTIVNGFGMLLFQGVLAYEIWTGVEVSSNLVKQIQNSFLDYI